MALNVAGTGVDRLKELSEGLSGADGEGIEIASGMSAEEETALAGEISDALADALAELGSDTSSPSGQDNTPSSPSTGSQSTNTSSGDSTDSGSNTSAELFLIKPVESIGKVAGNVKKFMTACADSMKVDTDKIKIASNGGSLGASEVLLVVIDKDLTIETTLNGSSIRGVCIFSSQRARVTINADDTKIGALLTYQLGSNNEATLSFGSEGKLDSGMATFSGSKNKVTTRSAKLTSCEKPYAIKLGSGSFECQ